MNPDKQLEQELALLKAAVSLSPETAHQLFDAARVTKATDGRYHVQEEQVIGRTALYTVVNYFNHMSSKLKIIIPAAIIILIVIVMVGRKQSTGPRVAISPTTSTGTVSDNSTATDEIINAMLSAAISEQSISDEANGDVSLAKSDSTQIDAFTSVYNANEY